jgi:hypothetical protein
MQQVFRALRKRERWSEREHRRSERENSWISKNGPYCVSEEIAWIAANGPQIKMPTLEALGLGNSFWGGK